MIRKKRFSETRETSSRFTQSSESGNGMERSKERTLVLMFRFSALLSLSKCVIIRKIIRQPPAFPCRRQHSILGRIWLNHRVRDGNGCFPYAHHHRMFPATGLPMTEQYNQSSLLLLFLRKEVIQPHLPIRLPCYDFTPVTGPAFGSSLLSVGSLTSGITDSHGVTGGVYKTRERIHRSILICDY